MSEFEGKKVATVVETDDYVAQVRALLAQCKDWNNGAGLVIPENLAEHLQKLGITENYSVHPTRLSKEALARWAKN